MLKLCELCNTMKNDTKRAVVKNVYRSSVCTPCLSGGILQPNDAKFNRERAREEHSKEILQPFDAKGEINSDFAYAYPDQAEEMFGKENLRDL